MQKFKKVLLITCLLSFILCGCTNESQIENHREEAIETEHIPMASQEIFAMDTYMTITGYGDNCEEAVEASVLEIQRLEALFSIGNDDSEVFILNENGTAKLSSDTEYVIKKALELYEDTNGAFDISIYPLMELWGFTTDEYQVPDQDLLENVLGFVDASKVQLDEDTDTVTIQDGQGVDLGGIAKGYTSGRIMEIFEEYGLVSGIVSLGGNVQCFSGKVDGSLWRCGIQDPDNPDALMCVVSVKDKAVITSGGYERYFIDGDTGKSWHHILNPKTGYSADSGLSSVTIVSRDGALADGLSTAVFVMGLENSIEFWATRQDEFDMILVTDDREIFITEGLSDNVTSDYAFNIISIKE